MKVTYFTIFMALFAGCKKFDHTDLSNSRCELCGYAQSLEGDYRGYIGSVHPQISDSVTTHVEQVFVGKSAIQDSLVIQLKMTYVSDNGSTIVDTIRIANNGGLTMDFSKDNPLKFRNFVFSITEDSMYFSNYFKVNHSYVSNYVGTLYKQ